MKQNFSVSQRSALPVNFGVDEEWVVHNACVMGALLLISMNERVTLLMACSAKYRSVTFCQGTLEYGDT